VVCRRRRFGDGRWVGFVLALSIASVASGARAETTEPPRPPRVSLFAVTADDPLAGRLAAELAALGLDVSREVIAPTRTIEEQVRAAFSTGARAAVIADGHRTEFWVAEEGTDRVALRQELEIEGSPGLDSVLSLRTVEFLRVSLGLATELESPRAQPPGVERAAPSPVPAAPRFTLDVTSGILVGSGRIGMLATVSAGLRARLVGPFGLELAGYVPLGSDTVSTPSDGDIQTSLWLAGGGLTFAPRLEGRFSVDAGAGLLAVVMRTVGVAPPIGDTGLTDQGVGMALYGRAAARLRFADRWSFRVDVTGGSTAIRPPVVLVFNSIYPPYEVTRWGRAFVAGLGGLDVVF
jgi:hypothetical protein